MSPRPPSRPAPAGGFNAVFIIGIAGDSYDLDWQSYTGQVAPEGLFDGTDNTLPAPFLLTPAADAQITAAGWIRTGEWSYTDDIWGCVVVPAERVPVGNAKISVSGEAER